MQDLSLHILDIVENSIDAGATKIEIMINEAVAKNLLEISIKDNGKGMGAKTIKKILDPFYTTKTVRRVGLGLSLFAQTVREAQGKLKIISKPNKGTMVKAQMSYNHIDRKPLGNMCDTLMALIGTRSEDIDFFYHHKKDGKEFSFSTKEIRRYLGLRQLNHPEVLKFLRKEIKRCMPR